MIERLRELEAAATKGPWQSTAAGSVITRDREWLIVDGDAAGSVYGSEAMPLEQVDANLVLIAEMRNALPALLAAAEALPPTPWMSAHPSDKDQRDICFWCFGRAPAHAPDCAWSKAMAPRGEG